MIRPNRRKIGTSTHLVETVFRAGFVRKFGQRRMGKALSSTSLLPPSGGCEILTRWFFVVDVTKKVTTFGPSPLLRLRNSTRMSE